MKKFFAIFIPIFILAFFLLIMISGSFFKKARGDWNNVPKHMEMIEKAVTSEEWKSAEENANKLDSAWQHVIKGIQFSSERNEINDLSLSIARLKAAIACKDKSLALIELNTAKQHWEYLGK